MLREVCTPLRRDEEEEEGVGSPGASLPEAKSRAGNEGREGVRGGREVRAPREGQRAEAQSPLKAKAECNPPALPTYLFCPPKSL